MARKPCVAGKFYPADPKELEKTITGYLSGHTVKKEAAAIIVPHAGYIYSGPVAGETFSSVEVPDNVILIGPNHTGLGKDVSIMASGTWATPLGEVKINDELASLILGSSKLFSNDSAAHLMEHSLEVQLPFLYHLNKSVSIVPVTVMQAGYRECEEIGNTVADAIKAYRKKTLIVISSDMNHYEPDKRTREKDRLAIDKILGLDAKGLLDVTFSSGITMCGVIPAAIGIVAAKRLNAKKANLLRYSTSGDISGDFSQVVGYAGIIIN